MKRVLLSAGLILLFGATSFAQVPESKYIAFTIPDSLRKNANAVMREDNMTFRVKSPDNAVLEVHSIVTILNEEAEGYLTFSQHSDKFSVLDDAEITVYNALGKKLNKYTKKEMRSVGYGDGLVEDGKVTYFRVSAATYPITIEQVYTIKYKGILEYPDNSILSPDVSTEHFSYIIEVPENIGLRYKMINSNAVPVKQVKDNTITYTWDITNMPAVKREFGSGPSERNFPKIAVSPNKFKIAGFEGDMTTWKSFGQWFYDLIGTDNRLSEKGQQYIRELVKNAGSDREKAQLIYSYLQRNMRYVSVQLGIGGWKPFNADFVQEKKYGDCKALSNYMQAALQSVGIKSYYAIVKGQPNGVSVMDDFPASDFNHVILCIPGAKDSTWLECTSSTSDFGVLGDFTENRKALLVTENGGVLVSTPKSRAVSNNFSCKSIVSVDEEGAGKISAVMSGTGEFRQEHVYYLNQKSSDEQIRYFVKEMQWKQPDVFSITPGNKTSSPFTTSFKMDYGQLYTFKAGSKMFLQTKLYPLFDVTVNDNEKRKQDYYFSYPYQKNDTTIFELPAGYIIETVPKEKTISTDFAKYECHYLWNEAARKLSIYTTLQITGHVIKAADYGQLMKFKKEVDADLNQRIVIKKS